MSKTHRFEPIRIESEDLPKVRKDWGNVRPFTRVEQNKKKHRERRACRDFKKNWKDYE